MGTTIVKLKRSAVQGNIPTIAQLVLGELSINTYDGKIFIKKNNGVDSIVEIGSGGIIVTEQQFTAAAAQTNFIILGKILGTPDIEIFTNRLVDYKSEYSITNNGVDTTITFTTGKLVNDLVRVVMYK